MKNLVFTISLLIALFTSQSSYANQPLYIWRGRDPRILGRIWAVSGVDSIEAKVVASIHQSVGWRCQSLASCPFMDQEGFVKFR